MTHAALAALALLAVAAASALASAAPEERLDARHAGLLLSQRPRDEATEQLCARSLAAAFGWVGNPRVCERAPSGGQGNVVGVGWS